MHYITEKVSFIDVFMFITKMFLCAKSPADGNGLQYKVTTRNEIMIHTQ